LSFDDINTYNIDGWQKNLIIEGQASLRFKPASTMLLLQEQFKAVQISIHPGSRKVLRYENIFGESTT